MTSDGLLFLSFFGTAYVLVFSFVTSNFTNISRAGTLVSTACALLSGLFSVVAAFLFAAQTGVRFAPSGISLAEEGVVAGTAWMAFAVLMFLVEFVSVALMIGSVGTFIYTNDRNAK